MGWITHLFLPRRPVHSCPECGAHISHKARFCEHCGAWLAKTAWLPCGSFNWGLVLENLADLLTLPTAGYPTKIQTCLANLPGTGNEARLMASFAARVHDLSTEQLQERYRRTFTLIPACSLEVGQQLYLSEREKHLEFVAWMRQEPASRKIKILPGYAPDNLILCLRAMVRMNAAGGEDFTFCVLPAVSKIVKAMQGTNNPFEALLLTVEWVLTPR
jgi:nitrate reductase assembly molybdenum cofactor insertion protein NarJ